MKTQIKRFINGARDVVRNEDDPKYQSAARSTSHAGPSGSSWRERFAVGEKVFAENGETMPVDVRGVKLNLKLGKSVCAKTKWYSAEISEKQANAIVGIPANYKWFTVGEGKWYFKISDDLYCSVYARSRRSPGADWRLRPHHFIDESFVTILEEGV